MEERVASVHDLRDGEMKQVLVGGKKVLLCKVDGRFYALGARCPHWGASLADGTLIGDHVACPLHQSLFAVRSGYMVEPPALDGIPSFKVRIEGEAVFVDRPDDAPSHVPAPMCTCQPEKDERVFVVVGGGGAAAAALEALREVCYEGRIVLVSDEDRWPYDRPNLSKDFLAGTVEAQWLPLRSAKFYERLGIERLHKRVVHLDPTTRTIVFEDGDSMTADAILIATGATPRTLGVPGEQLANVFTLRTWKDAELLTAALTNLQESKGREGTRAVVVGASFIGMESAAALAQRQVAVTVVAAQEVPFAHVLGEPVGRLVQHLHEEHGTRFALGRQVKRFLGEGAVQRVELDDGTLLEADLVVVGVGVQPATDFVVHAEKSPDGGLIVSDRLEVAPGVWAAGDVATYPDRWSGQPLRIEHWRVAEQQGRVAARAMAGQSEPFTATPFFWTQHFDVQLSYAGVARRWTEIIVNGDLAARDFTAFYVEDNRVAAACGTQTDVVSAFALALDRGRQLAPDDVRQRTRTDLLEVFADR